MNESRLPPDELASAHLDDALTAEGTEAARQVPDLAERLAALRRAATAVGETVTPPPGAADAAVAAALADVDARRDAPESLAPRRRGLAVIAGVAAAVAVGFIVAAAVGLFAERVGDTDATVALPAAPAPAATQAPESAPEPQQSAVADLEAIDDSGPPAADAEPAAEACSATVELRVTLNDTTLLVVQRDGGPPAVLNAATCEELPAADTLEPAAEACAAAVGASTVERRVTLADMPLLVVQRHGGPFAVLDAIACDELPPG
ncbi:MAG: hypothetical protein OXI48_08370 [bacterium]|nr:hypothetical protein [bacterium]